jgi:PAS domain S-box-containing protein
MLLERQAIMESIPDGPAMIDPAGQVIYQNRASLELHGYVSLEEACLPQAQMEEQWELIDLDGRPVPIGAWSWSRALRGETFTGYELRVRRRDGTRELIATYGGSLVRSPAGDPLFALLVVRDITEHKRAEDALRKSKVRYRTLVEATGAVTWTCPPSGLHVAPQPAWMAFTGQTAEGMLGAGWAEAVHPEDAAAVARRRRPRRDLYQRAPHSPPRRRVALDERARGADPQYPRRGGRVVRHEPGHHRAQAD